MPRPLGWEETPSLARSTWRFADEKGDPWVGLLLVSRVAGNRERRLAYFHAEWDE